MVSELERPIDIQNAPEGAKAETIYGTFGIPERYEEGKKEQIKKGALRFIRPENLIPKQAVDAEDEELKGQVAKFAESQKLLEATVAKYYKYVKESKITDLNELRKFFNRQENLEVAKYLPDKIIDGITTQALGNGDINKYVENLNRNFGAPVRKTMLQTLKFADSFIQRVSEDPK